VTPTTSSSSHRRTPRGAPGSYGFTRSVFDTSSGPRNGPVSNDAVIVTAADWQGLGTRTEAGQKVPHAKPEVAESSRRPCASVRRTAADSVPKNAGASLPW